MSSTLEQLASEAIALSPEDRARLADILSASLPESADESLSPEWDEELERRIAAVESGAGNLVAAADVQAAARRIFNR